LRLLSCQEVVFLILPFLQVSAMRPANLQEGSLLQSLCGNDPSEVMCAVTSWLLTVGAGREGYGAAAAHLGPENMRSGGTVDGQDHLPAGGQSIICPPHEEVAVFAV
jgi:hypothetical protein